MNYYVYILQSLTSPEQIYIGYTTNLDNRLEDHAVQKACAHTKKYAPWKLETYMVFNDKTRAENFEIYLKSHSGRAFLRKRLI